MMEPEPNTSIVPEHGQPEETPHERKSWTVLTFLGGENNLSDEMIFAIKAMKSSVHVPPGSRGGTPEFNFHAPVQFAAETSLLNSPVRFYVTPVDIDGSAHADYVPTLPQERAPYWKKHPKSYVAELVDFLYWGIKQYPADNYFVIFSGHGTGIEDSFLVKESIPPESLTIKQMRAVLEHEDVKAALRSVGNKDRIDVLGFDSCLMSMVEVCYELRKTAGLLVASQGSEANLGWPYKAIFEYLQQPGAADSTPEELAGAVVDCMMKYYVDFSIVADSSADLAVCDLTEAKIRRLVRGIDTLGKVIMKRLPDKTEDDTIERHRFLRALIFAHWYGQTYRNDQYADLFDFCDVLSRNVPAELNDVRAACIEIQEAVRDFSYSCYTGPMYQYSHGVSIYLPWSEIYPPYKNSVQRLDFLKHTCWLDFVGKYIEKTRRPARPGIKFRTKFDEPETKDNVPRTKGSDDPLVRAKNPAHNWHAQECLWKYLENVIE